MSKFTVKGKALNGTEFFAPKAQYSAAEFKAMFEITSLRTVGKAIYADGTLIGGHSVYHEDDGDEILINEYEYTADGVEYHFVTFRLTTNKDW